VKGLLGCLFLVSLVSCASSTEGSGPYEVLEERARDSRLAEDLTREAAALIEEDAARAESLLREALTADIFHGPAHNNLGVIFLSQGKLYEAAHEFEWARKLLPGHPDPRVNLALTLESAGRVDEALAAFDSALEVYPDYLPAIMGAAVLSLRSGRECDRLSEWLAQIATRCQDLEWQAWARLHLADLP